MITDLRIVESKSLIPYENMHLEEQLLYDVRPGECILYLWQNSHTIVVGRNQNIWKECRVNEFTESGGLIARRLSGGGAVYHDLGNLNFTFLAQIPDYDVDRQLDVILRALLKLGITARKTGRNDLAIDGRKFSGNAFYKSGNRCFHHGTIMLDVDTAVLTKYLSASSGKLASRGVESVKSRIINISEAYGSTVSTDMMKKCLKEAFYEYGTEKNVKISEDGPDSIYKLEAESITDFSSWEWIYGKNIDFNEEVNCESEKGRIGARLYVTKGYIKEVLVDTDFMEPIETHIIEQQLTGRRYNTDDVRKVLTSVI